MAEAPFIFVGKLQSSPFYDMFAAGLAAAAGGVPWRFTGPVRYSDDLQAEAVETVLEGPIAGLGVAGSPSPRLHRAMQGARAAGLPVVTFDADVPASASAARAATVGSSNHQLGLTLASLAHTARPGGGRVRLHGGVATAGNHAERLAGVMQGLDRPGFTLAGPTLYTPGGDHGAAVQALRDVLAGDHPPEIVIAVGPFAQWEDARYRAAVGPFRSQILDDSLVLLHGDGLPVQVEQLRDGLSSGQVAQRPGEMAASCMQLLTTLAAGGRVPPAVTTGLDILTRSASGKIVSRPAEAATGP